MHKERNLYSSEKSCYWKNHHKKDQHERSVFAKSCFNLSIASLKFELVQFIFKDSRFLTHFGPLRQFLIDVDAFKNKFEAFVYHLRREDRTKFTAIESIVFLRKILTSIENRYWFIELEIVAVVWVIKKLHHMISAFRHLTIIWTDLLISLRWWYESSQYTVCVVYYWMSTRFRFYLLCGLYVRCVNHVIHTNLIRSVYYLRMINLHCSHFENDKTVPFLFLIFSSLIYSLDSLTRF